MMSSTTKRTEVVIVTTEGEARTEVWEGNTLDHLRQAVNGPVMAVDLAPGLDVWLSDERRSSDSPNWLVTGYVGQRFGTLVQPLYGTAIFTGVDAGETVSIAEDWRRDVLTGTRSCEGCGAEPGEPCSPLCLSSTE